MKAVHLLANISREFLISHGVARYRKKNIADISDEEVISFCHRYSEDERLSDEFFTFCENAKDAYRWCSYLEEFIEDGDCWNIQLIVNEVINSAQYSECHIDIDKATLFCSECKYKSNRI